MSPGKGSYFRRYWIGEALSTFGTRTGQIAYPLLALELTGSPAKAGLLAFGRSAAWLVLSLPAGAIVDRIDRRRLMIGCDLASAVATATLVAALAAGTLTYEQLLLVASVGSLVAFGGAALGPLVAGLLASRSTGAQPFLCVAAIGTVVALGGVAAWSRGLRSVAAEAPA